MDNIEKYHFDLHGYIVIKKMLDPTVIELLRREVDELEKYALDNINSPPYKKSKFTPRPYVYNLQKGFHALGPEHSADTLIIEDFYNASIVFDSIIGHEKTMQYVNAVVPGNVTLNNSEIRIRYVGNKTNSHMGGPMSKRFSYDFFRGDIQDALDKQKNCEINCSMVRILYALHDISIDDGAFCVVPGSHKANYHSPYSDEFPEREPGMIGIELQAGDAILFTENLRHGGLPNNSSTARKTIHLGFGPEYMKSQNMATHDEMPFILQRTYDRYSDSQKKLFTAYIRENMLDEVYFIKT